MNNEILDMIIGYAESAGLQHPRVLVGKTKSILGCFDVPITIGFLRANAAVPIKPITYQNYLGANETSDQFDNEESVIHVDGLKQSEVDLLVLLACKKIVDNIALRESRSKTAINTIAA